MMTTDTPRTPPRKLSAHDVALYDDLCKAWIKTDKRQDEHWLAAFALERYDQIMPALLAALTADERKIVEACIAKREWGS